MENLPLDMIMVQPQQQQVGMQTDTYMTYQLFVACWTKDMVTALTYIQVPRQRVQQETFSIMLYLKKYLLSQISL